MTKKSQIRMCCFFFITSYSISVQSPIQRVIPQGKKTKSNFILHAPHHNSFKKLFCQSLQTVWRRCIKFSFKIKGQWEQRWRWKHEFVTCCIVLLLCMTHTQRTHTYIHTHSHTHLKISSPSFLVCVKCNYLLPCTKNSHLTTVKAPYCWTLYRKIIHLHHAMPLLKLSNKFLQE